MATKKKTEEVKYIKNVLINGVSSYVPMTEEEIEELKAQEVKEVE